MLNILQKKGGKVTLENDMNKKVGKATMWSSITEVMAKLVTPFVNILLARLLLPEAFGIVATITLVISFAEIFTDAGFQKYIIQHEFKDEDELNRSTNVAFWTNLSVSLIACLVIFIFRNQIAAMVGNPNLGVPISVASLLILLHAFSSIQMARYKRDLDFKTLFFVRMGSVLIPVLVTIPMAFIFRNFWALLIGNFANQVFYSIVLTWKSKWKIKLYFNFSLFKEMFSFTAWTMLESISIWLTANIDIFIIGKYLTDYHLGLYKTSMSTINSYMGLVTTAVLPVLFSALSRYQNDDEQFKSTYNTFQRLTSVLVIPMGIGVFVFSDLVTTILLGKNWIEASGFIGWWALTTAIAIPTARFSSEVVRSKGKPLVSLLVQISQIVVLIPALLLVRNGSFETLYIVRSLIRFEFIIVSIVVLCAMFKFSLVKIILNIVPSLLSSVAMAGIGYLLLMINNNILWQLVWVLVCIVVYFGVLTICFPTTRRELLSLSFVQKFIDKFKKK